MPLRHGRSGTISKEKPPSSWGLLCVSGRPGFAFRQPAHRVIGRPGTEEPARTAAEASLPTRRRPYQRAGPWMPPKWLEPSRWNPHDGRDTKSLPPVSGSASRRFGRRAESARQSSIPLGVDIRPSPVRHIHAHIWPGIHWPRSGAVKKGAEVGSTHSEQCPSWVTPHSPLGGKCGSAPYGYRNPGGGEFHESNQVIVRVPRPKHRHESPRPRPGPPTDRQHARTRSPTTGHAPFAVPRSPCCPSCRVGPVPVRWGGGTAVPQQRHGGIRLHGFNTHVDIHRVSGDLSFWCLE